MRFTKIRKVSLGKPLSSDWLILTFIDNLHIIITIQIVKYLSNEQGEI